MTDNLLDTARRVIRIEANALQELEASLDDSFTRALDLILAAKGRVIVSGMGKSGHIARKIAATLASTGTPAHFVHPAEPRSARTVAAPSLAGFASCWR